MIKLKQFSLLIASFLLIQACYDKQASGTEKVIEAKKTSAINRDAYNNTKGYWNNGEIISHWDCPDSRFFLPIDIRSWDKTPAVNGRLATYEETMNGTAIHHYGEKRIPDVKPYNMTLPKLAWRYNPSIGRDEIVVVIQIVETAQDTIAGFRYLTGGCGGSTLRDFHFLTTEEIKEAVE
ncbi:MAG: hypothetical protein ACJ76F_05260 [Bacteroidia bacterium]